MKIKKYKPVRVVNPTATWHTTRLYPRQKMVVKLRKPSRFLWAADETAEFEVNLYSDFLMVEHVDFDVETGDKVYTISQKFDLTSWSEYGEVLLGELNIKLINNTHKNKEEQDYCCNICVIMKSKLKDDVITVINPGSHSVKVEPHQLLEVVCYESAWNNKTMVGLRDEWDFVENELVSNSHKIKLKQLKYEIAGDRSGVLTKDEGPFVVKNRFEFQANPTLSSQARTIVELEIKSFKNPIREHHWWFAFDEHTLKKSLDLGNGVYQVCTLDFEGQCRESVEEAHYSATRSMDVLLTVLGKNKHKMHPYYLNPDSVEHKMEIVKRAQDHCKRVLTNPFSAEQVDFHPGYESVILEIVQPNCMWADLDNNVEWTFSIDDNHLAPKHIKIIPMNSFFRWNKLFQRVRIDHDYKPNDVETKFLGAVYIRCDPRKESHDGSKRISFWFSPHDRKATPYKTKLIPQYESYSTVSCNPNGSKKKEKEYRGPRIATVEIEELDCKRLEDALKTKDMWITNKVCHHVTEDYQQVPKKKETSSTLDYPFRSYNARASENGSETKEGTSAKKESNTSSSETCAKISTDNHNAPFIIYTPDHLYKITLEYGQSLIVRMSLPHKVYVDKCDDKEHWSLTWDTGSNEGFKVTQFKTVAVSDSLYQEAIAVIDKVPVVHGIHPVGCLRFHSSLGTRVAFVQVRVLKGDNVERPAVVAPPMRIVEPTKCFDGTSSRKLYISEWLHNDAISVSPQETFYVRNPGHISGWDSSTWHMELQQYPLSNDVWRHELLREILNDVDIDNPWFATSHPLQLTAMYLFRPLTIQQPHVMRILHAAAEVLDDDYLTIARIVFRNSKHNLNSSLMTAVGVMDTEYKMERSLGICIPLYPYRPKELMLENPLHKEEVLVSDNEMLIVKLAPRAINTDYGLVESPWFVGPWPQFLEFRGQSKIGVDSVFRFKVRADYPENKSEWVKFICGDTQKLLLAKYEKK